MLPERYMPRKIAKISKTDKKVSIVGRVAELMPESDSFVLDDDSGKIEIFFEKENSEGREKIERTEKIESGKFIRAFCTLVGEQLKLDTVQSLNGLDINLLKTVEELYEKAGV